MLPVSSRRHVAKPGAGDRTDDIRPVRSEPHTRHVYASLRARSVTWAERERQLASSSAEAAILLEELFCALYDDTIELAPDTAPAFHWQFKTIAEMVPLADFARLREQTVGDAVAAAMAAWRLTEKVMQDAADAKQRRRRRWLRIRTTREREEVSGVESGRERLFAAPMYSVIRAVQDVRGMAEADARLRGVWGIAPGKRSVHGLDDVWRLVDGVRALPDFSALTEALEQFRRRLASAGHKRRGGPGRGVQRLVGWERGADLERAIPEEMVRLGDPDLQYLFFEAYEHRRLLQMRYEGHQPGPKGPIVCCMDVSRSMNTPAAMGRERFLWAKAAALALVDVARRSHRPFVGICFSSEHELATFQLPAGGYSPDEAIAMAACDFDGGTHFQAPLQQALSHMQDAQGQDGGHIVFITDGEAALPETFRRRFRQAKEKLDVRLFTVFIDGRHEELASLSDHVFEVASGRVGSWETTVSGVGRSITGR